MASLMLWLPLLALRSLVRHRVGYVVDALIVALGLAMLLRHELDPIAPPAWAWLPAYPFIAGAVFLASVWFTTDRPRAYLRQLVLSMGCCSGHDHRRLLAFSLLTAAYEELVWRYIAQPALAVSIGMIVAVPVVALAFVCLHRHRTGGNLPQIIEIVCFSLLLGSLYALTGDPTLVVLIHTTRNYLIHIGQLNREEV